LITQGARLCSVPRDRAMVVTSWSCTEDAPGVELIRDVWPTPTGSVWIAAHPHGVYRLGHDGFERLGAVAPLPSPVVRTLAPSPRGGVWVAASGATLRVEEAPDTRDGWRVVERLDAWHGLMTTGVNHVAETEHGDLWLASSAGLIRMPAVARSTPVAVPAARIVEVLANGRSLDPDIAATLPAGDQALQLRFAAASLRAPDLVRYRVQVGDGAWSPPRSGADLQLLDLRPGTWTIGVAASLDGQRWGEPDRFELFVPTPWYLRTVVWLIGAAVLIAL
jgi:ligand-binding sensor domain-containing protein